MGRAAVHRLDLSQLPEATANALTTHLAAGPQAPQRSSFGITATGFTSGASSPRGVARPQRTFSPVPRVALSARSPAMPATPQRAPPLTATTRVHSNAYPRSLAEEDRLAQ